MYQPSLIGLPRLNPCAAAIAAAFALQAGSVVAQQIIVDGHTNTVLTIDGRVTDVTTGTIHGPNAFNTFQRFNVDGGNVVNLHVPTAASNLINLIHGEQTRIDGILNTVQGGNIGGNVFFLNPHGIVVGRDGIINAGALTLITPTKGFSDSFFDASGVPNGAATAAVLAGQVPIGETGLVTIQGRINVLTDLKIHAGAVVHAGILQSGAFYQNARADFADVVNVAGLRNADTIRVTNGVIEILASNDIDSGGAILAEGANGVDGGTVRLQAGRDLRITDGIVSARGSGVDSNGGTVTIFANGDATLAVGARVDASAGATGDGGFVEFSARNTVHLQGGGLAAAAAGGKAGTIVIDPTEILWTGSGQDVFSDGADYLLWATDRIVLDDVVLSTRQVAGTGRDAHRDGASIGASGKLYLWAGERVELRNGTQLLSHATDGFAAGEIRVGSLGAPVDLGLPSSALAGLPGALDDGLLSNEIVLDNAMLRGGGIRLLATESVSMTGSLLVSRTVAAGADAATGIATGASGSIQVEAPALTLTDSQVLAHAGNGFAAGNVELQAESIDELGAVKAATTTITLTRATVRGGDISVSAYADTSLLVSLINAGQVPDLAAAQRILDDAVADPLNAAVPLDVTSSAEAKVLLNDSALFASQDATVSAVAGARQGFDKKAIAEVELRDSQIEAGRDVHITSQSDTSLVLNVLGGTLLDNSGLPSEGDLSVINDQLFDFSATSFVALVESRAKTLITGDTRLDALAGDITLDATAKANAKPTTSLMILAAAWADATAEAKTSVGGMARVTAADKLTVKADTDSEVNATATIASQKKPIDITFVKAELDADTTAEVLDGTRLRAGAIEVAAKTVADVTASANATNSGGSNAGFAIALNLTETDTTARVGGDVATTTGDIAITATTDIERNSTQTTAGSLGSPTFMTPYTDYLAKVQQNQGNALLGATGKISSDKATTITEFLFPTFKEGKFNLSGAVTWAEGDNTARAEIATGARVIAEGNLDVKSSIANKVNASADAKATSQGAAIGGSIVIGDYVNDAQARIGSSAVVDARGVLTVDAQVTIPYPWEIEWTSPAAVLNHLQGNLLDLALTSYALNSSSGKGSVGLSAAVGLITFDNTARAIIDTDAAVNTDAAYRSAAQSVAVHAQTEVNSINVAGVVSKKLLGNTAGRLAVGGSANILDITGTTEASIRDGADVRAGGNITVDAESKNQLITVTEAGGKSDQIGVEGAVSINIIRNTTTAHIDDKADIDAGGHLHVDAVSDLNNVSITGGVVKAAAVGVGLSVTYNFIEGATRAYIGNRLDSGDAAAGTGVIRTGGDLRIKARTDNDINAYSLAGAITTGTSTSAQTPSSAGETPSDSTGNASSAGLEGGIANDASTTAGQSGASGGSNSGSNQQAAGAQKGKYGIAVSGDASVNEISSDTEASIDDGVRITRTGALDVIADADSNINAFSGSVAISTSGQKSAGLAGSFAWNQTGDTTRAWIGDVRIDEAGAITVDASTGGSIQAVTASGSGAGKVGIAGSVSINQIDNETLAYLQGAEIVGATSLTVRALDDSAIWSGAGALGIGGKAGIGLSAAINTISNRTEAGSEDSSALVSGAILFQADTDADIRSLAAALGASAGTMAAAGSVVVSDIDNTTRVYANGIAGTPTLQAAGSIDLKAQDSSSIYAASGAVGGAGGSAGFGASATANLIGNVVEAIVDGAQLLSTGHQVRLQATSEAEIYGITVGGGGSGMLGIAATVTYNDVDNVTQAGARNGAQLRGAGGVTIDADDDAEITSLAGAVAGAGNVSVGASAAVNDVTNTTAAFSTGSTLVATAGGITLEARSGTTIDTGAVGASISGDVALAGSATLNRIANTTSAYASGSALTASGALRLTAADDSTIAATAGAIAAAVNATGVAGGAAVSGNLIDNSLSAHLENGSATASAITVEADAGADVYAGALGGAGGAVFALGGSITLNRITNDTTAEVRGASGTATAAGNILIDAEDTSTIYSGAGSVAIGGTAFGIAVSVNDIGNTVSALVSAAQVQSTTGAVTLSAANSSTINSVAFGVAGATNAALAGSVTFNRIRNETRAGGSAGGRMLAAGAIHIDATDASGINSAAGAIGIAFGGGVAGGAGVATNDVGNVVQATLSGGLAQSSAGSVAIDAAATTVVTSAAIAGAGADQFALGGSVVWNDIANTVEVTVGNGATITAPGAITLTADDDSEFATFAGAVAASGTGAVGASLSTNAIANRIAVEVDDATVRSAAGTATLTADSDATITAFTVGGSGAGTFALGGAVSLNDIGNTLTVRVTGGSLVEGLSGVAMTARDESTVRSLAGAVAFSASASVGASAATNEIDNTIEVVVIDAEARSGNGKVRLLAQSDASVESLSAGGAVSANAALAGAVSFNRITNDVSADAGAGAVLSGGAGVELDADDTSGIESLAGQVTVAGALAIGGSAAYNEIGNTVRARATNAQLASSAGSILLTADSHAGVDTIAAGASVAFDITQGGGALAGSLAINVFDNHVEASATGSTLTAEGSVGLVANYDGSGAIYAGTAAVGTALGAGGSMAVSTLANTVDAFTSGSTVHGKGNGAITVPKADGSTGVDTVRGVVVAAHTMENIDVWSANLAGGGAAGLAATLAITSVTDTTRAFVSGGSVNASNAGAHADQRVRVEASNRTDVDVKAGAVALGGAAGVGATSDTTIIGNTTEAAITGGGQVNAQKAVDVRTTTLERVNAIVVSGAGSFGVGVSGSLSLVMLDGTNTARIDNATVKTSGDLSVIAEDDILLGVRDDGTRSGLSAGALAIGGVAGVGGSIVVLDVSNDTTARISDATTDASGTTRVAADTFVDAVTYAITGSLGAFAGAGAISVSAFSNTTQALIDERSGTTRVNQDATYASSIQDVTVEAQDTLALTGQNGAVSVGITLGAGAAIDVVSVRNSAQAYLGAGTEIDAQRDVRVAATSGKSVSSTVIAAGGGLIGVQGAVSVINIGAGLSDDGEDAASNTKTLVNNQVGVSAVGNALGGSGTATTAKTRVDAQRVGFNANAAFDKSAAAGATAAAFVGDGADIGGRDVTITATDTTTLQTRAGAAAIGVVGVGGGVSIASVKTDVRATVGEDATVAATRHLALDANGNVTGSTIRGIAGAAGLVGLGAAVADVALANAVTAGVGSNARVSGGSSVGITADDVSGVQADALGASVGAYSAGVVYADAVKQNTVTASVGAGAEIAGGTTTIAATSSGAVGAHSVSAAAGLVGAGSGAAATAKDNTTVTAGSAADATFLLGNAALSVTATGRPQTHAEAEGVSIAAGLRIGVSVAYADSTGHVHAGLGTGNTVTAGNVTVQAKTEKPGAGNSTEADAFAAGGGVLAGISATESRAHRGGSVTSGIGADSTLTLSGSLTVAADGASRQRADVDGYNGGILAVGSNESKASSNTAVSTTLGSGVGIGGTALTVRARADDDNFAAATSGSGGLVSGAASTATTDTRGTSTVTIGAASGGRVIDVTGAIDIDAERIARFNATANSINAAAVGVSGAWTINTVDSDALVNIAAGADLTGGSIAVDAINRTRKLGLANDGYNIESGSGGILNAAAANSTTDIDNVAIVTIGDGATVRTDTGGAMTIEALNDIVAYDKTKLDAGGAIAVARAESSIRADRNDARIDLAGPLDSGADLSLSARTVADVRAATNAKTYGGAGAAQGDSLARVQADNRVNVLGSATLRAENDVNLLAGRNADTGATNDVKVAARTDLWNKTALPIETDPEADGAIVLHQNVTVAAGAEVGAVGNVAIGAEDGQLAAEGVGIGKDLYRELAAEIASAFSNLVGQGDVSLDIRAGTSSIGGVGGVVIDGTVKAGIQHNQFLTIGANGQVAIGSDGLPIQSEGVTFSRIENVSLANELQTRINQLRALAIEYAQVPEIAGAFTAEADFLEIKLADLGGSNPIVDFIVVDDVLARSGDVRITGKYLVGQGEIEAPGDTRISILNQSAEFLRVNKLTIPEDEGGHITFNGAGVSTNGAITAKSLPGFGTQNFTLADAQNSAKPVIEVKSTNTTAAIAPGVFLDDDISNRRGDVIIYAEGDVAASGSIDAQSVQMKAGRDVILGYVYGFRHLGGDPSVRSPFAGLASASQLLAFDRSVDPAAESYDPSKGITAGNNVFISGERLNINTTIQSGRPDRSIVIDATMTAGIDQAAYDAAKSAGGNPDSLVPLNFVEGNEDQLASDHIRAWYNYETRQIELESVRVEGGKIVLYGDIFSTGNGHLKAVDGYGQIDIVNDTGFALALKRTDTGGNVEAIVQITDTARRYDDGGVLRPITTTYTRDGSTIEVTRSYVNGTGDRIALSTDDSQTGRITNYQPVENRRFNWVAGKV
ncbi:MAG: leukotoxin LktA family filamentous adhesin, partial [Burkholderiales bacterium]|nr:leukotoxin LktA family filamentous adhesin [Burkholderiales bacterium]